jgi:hypothetical protein
LPDVGSGRETSTCDDDVSNIDYNSVQEGKSDSQPSYAAITARSYHAGLVLAVFMDGSVREVDDEVSLAVWRAMGTANGGD